MERVLVLRGTICCRSTSSEKNITKIIELEKSKGQREGESKQIDKDILKRYEIKMGGWSYTSWMHWRKLDRADSATSGSPWDP